MAEVRRRLLSYSKKYSTVQASSVPYLWLCNVTSHHPPDDAHKLTHSVVLYGAKTRKHSIKGIWNGVPKTGKLTCITSSMFGSQKVMVVGNPIYDRSKIRCFSQTTYVRASNNYYNGTHHRSNNESQALSPLYRSRTAYYDILEVTKRATQSQIKTAYYKQSFRFHPDRNSGSEQAANRFSEVSEAYLVLGSVHLRKKYDHGNLSWEDVRTAGKPNGKEDNSPRRDISSRRGASTSTSSRFPSKPMFDFDAFYQAHYGEQLERERFIKERREQIQRRKNEPKYKWRFYKIGEMSAILLLLSAMLLLMSLK
ncbi:dnaJ homolog subfamily C member 30, mitochondrial [Bombina bombina]|uniref:dnaJ homolog subfamily C member 30, mitochondrial n=1 Tax=Bombina bombina TaxID=8345 RepID=UPI00235A7C78|nr:dnaJ homolog subfamily C member 30, mitochondrial [Bombina bombina]